jgi:hypothetical protein
MDVAEQIEKDQERPVALVKLANDHYQHKSYGRVYTPVFNVQDWISLDGEGDASPSTEEPVRRRRG